MSIEYKKEYKKLYYQMHKEKIKAYIRNYSIEYYENNREKVLKRASDKWRRYIAERNTDEYFRGEIKKWIKKNQIDKTRAFGWSYTNPLYKRVRTQGMSKYTRNYMLSNNILLDIRLNDTKLAYFFNLKNELVLELCNELGINLKEV